MTSSPDVRKRISLAVDNCSVARSSAKRIHSPDEPSLLDAAFSESGYLRPPGPGSRVKLRI